MPCGPSAVPSATRPPVAARPSHASSTQQSSVLPAKERAPTPNLASGGRRKVPSSRRRLALAPATKGIPEKGGGESVISGDASVRGFVLACPHCWVFICMLSRDGTYRPPENVFFASLRFFPVRTYRSTFVVSDGGFPTFSEAFPARGFFSRPLFWVFIWMEGVFWRGAGGTSPGILAQRWSARLRTSRSLVFSPTFRVLFCFIVWILALDFSCVLTV